MIKSLSIALGLGLTLSACGGKEAAKRGGSTKESQNAESADDSNESGKKASSQVNQGGDSTDSARPVDAEGTEESSFALTEEELDAANGQVEEALDGLGEESDDSGMVSKISSTFQLPRLSRTSEAERSRLCTEAETGSVFVHTERSASATAQAQGDLGQASTSRERSFVRDREWSREGETLHCNSAKTALSLPFTWTSLDGLHLNSLFSRKIDRSASVNGVQVADHVETKGRRTFTFKADQDGDMIRVEHSVNVDIERIRTVERRDGTTDTFKSFIRTVPELPLIVVRERQAGHLIANKVTYQSGSLQMQLRNGNILGLTLSDVVVDREQGVCKRRSGTIEGQVFGADEQPLKTFTIDLDADEIRYSDDTTAPFHARICD